MTEGGKSNNLLTTLIDYFIPILELYDFREEAGTCVQCTVGDIVRTHQRCVHVHAFLI